MHCRSATSVHVGPAGVLALPAHVTRRVLEVMLSDAREFVADWLEMRPVLQHRLFGQCLRPPLQVQRPARSQYVQSSGIYSQDLDLHPVCAPLQCLKLVPASQSWHNKGSY